jgi:hypothetical protein
MTEGLETRSGLQLPELADFNDDDFAVVVGQNGLLARAPGSRVRNGGLGPVVNEFIEGVGENLASRETREEVSVLDEAKKKSVLLSGPTERGLYTWDPDIDPATHQAVGRTSSYIAPNPVAYGAWRNDNGAIKASSLGIKPGAAYASDNVAKWNTWRNQMGDLQTRQEPSPLTLEFDKNQAYYFNASTFVLQQNIKIDCAGSVIDFTGSPYGFRFESQAPVGSGLFSVNHVAYCGIENGYLRGASVTPLRCVNSPYFNAKNMTIYGGSGGPALHMVGPISPWLRNIRIIGGQRGGLIEAGVIDTVTGKTLVLPFNIQMDGFYVVGCDTDAFNIWEASGVRISNFAAEVNGGLNGRGLDIGRCLGVSIKGVYNEKQRYDLVFDDTKRIQRLYNRAGSITNGSAIVTATNTAGFWQGMPVTGAGIPASASILSVDSGTQFTMTANATTTDGAAALSMGYDNAYGNYEVNGAMIGGELLQPGNIVPHSILLLGDHRNVGIESGRYGSQIEWAGAGAASGTGHIGPSVELGAGGLISLPAGVNDYRARLFRQAAVAAPTGGAVVDAEGRAAVIALRDSLIAAGLLLA